MPQAAPLFSYLGTILSSAATWKAIAIFAIKMAVSYAISRALAPKPGKLGSMASPIQMSREAAAARRVIYGETRVSGPMVFAHVSGEKNENIDIVVALAGHECESIGELFISDEYVPIDGAGSPESTSKYFGKLGIGKWYGDDAARSALVTNSGGVWTSAHRLRGCTALHAKLVFDQEVYPQGLPNISAVVKGKRLHDPRTETTSWSNNPALELLDYMRDADIGMGCDDSEIDFPSFIAAANICDEAVALLAGGTEKRYRCDGVFATDGEPASIIEQIVGSMAGSLSYVGGKFTCRAGCYEVPTITLSESDLRGPINYQPAAGRRDVCNIVKGTYTSPVDLYQPRDFPQYKDAAHITEDDGEEITRDLSLDWVHSTAQAQRLAAIEEKASRFGGVLELQCNLSAMRVKVGDSITVTNKQLGWSTGEVFRVMQFKLSTENGTPGVDLVCRRTSADIYGWTAATDEVYVPPGGTPSTGGGAYTIPTGEELPGGDFGDLDLGDLTFEEAIGGCEYRSLSGTTYPLGRPTYGTALTPPQFYLREDYSGSISYRTNVGDCGTAPSGNGEDHEFSGATVIDPLHYDTETRTGQRKHTVYSWGNATESTHSKYTQIIADPYPGVYASEVTATTSTISGTDACVSGTISSITTGTATSTLSVESTDEDAIARAVALDYSWGAWGSSTSTAIAGWQIRTGTTFAFAKVQVRGSWAGGRPNWEYTVTVNMESTNYGEAAWVPDGQLKLKARASASGVITLPPTDIPCPRGKQRRVAATPSINWNT